jgi:thymidine kinase
MGDTSKCIPTVDPECHIRVGPMFSGKTGFMNAELTRLADSTPWKVLRISYIDDIRETAGVDVINRITSHSSSFKGLSDNIDVQMVKCLREVKAKDYHVIGIDEGQFYPDLYESVMKWMKAGKRIYVSSLDSYSNGKLAGQVSKLLPYSNSFIKLTANCTYCMGKGIIRDAVLTTCEFNKETDVHIGGSDKYSPACFNCHREHNIS